MPADEHIFCANCGTQYLKEELEKDCGNCFSCTGCETYTCPNCDHEIVVIPLKKPAIKKIER